jgi:hypothetical protein
MRILFLFALVFSSVDGVFGGVALERLPPKTAFHLYLLIGQSNMAGRGKQDPAYAVANDRILKLTAQGTWELATEPLHFDSLARAGQTTGLGMSFARTMADADTNTVIGLIPCAVGGTPLSRWVKGGDLYAEAMRRTRLAMKDGALMGILWHQGENDAMAEQTASTYGARLAKMIADLRNDLGAGQTPFVAGKLGDFLQREASPPQYALPFWPEINRQLEALPQHVPFAAVADSIDLSCKDDRLHFDTPALREFGKRYAKAMLTLQQKMIKHANNREFLSPSDSREFAGR